jgi:hypothetical protein
VLQDSKSAEGKKGFAFSSLLMVRSTDLPRLCLLTK